MSNRYEPYKEQLFTLEIKVKDTITYKETGIYDLNIVKDKIEEFMLLNKLTCKYVNKIIIERE
ncbi:MAG: hypothetical protein SFU99_03980 [Saprospiraceae bacterium]|nr:hypothetical protein [Saprospiraceae bacterium]